MTSGVTRVVAISTMLDLDVEGTKVGSKEEVEGEEGRIIFIPEDDKEDELANKEDEVREGD
jgi:hypothetical protein